MYSLYNAGQSRHQTTGRSEKSLVESLRRTLNTVNVVELLQEHG
jgi:hypothetical protein